MKTILGMTASAAALSALAFVAMATPAARAGEFCSTNTSGMRGCGYTSMEQCQAATNGVFGSCTRDPYYADANAALADQPKHAARNAAHPAKPSAEH